MEIIEDISTKQMAQSSKDFESENIDVCTVILKVDNPKVESSKKLYDLNLFGKTLLEWVENSVFDTTIRYADYTFGEDFLPAVKRAVDTKSKYTFVLFSDAPLFQHKTFLQILEYFKMKELSVLKLTRGYVFETKYLLEIESLLNPQIQYFEEEDFITCHSLKQYTLISDIMKNRILNYFMKNGVIIEDPSSTFVDADVQIGKGTVIAPFNQIKGQSVVECDVCLNSHNVITDSVICEGAKIQNSTILKSFVGKNVKIFEYSKICDSKICDDATIPSHCLIKDAIVTKDDKLESFFSYIGEWYDFDCWTWKLWNRISKHKSQCRVYGCW